jgi:hypothetical protein
MSLESDVFDAIKGLVSNRVFPDVAPLSTTRPYVTYQQVGGDAVNYMESVHPGRRHARIQVNVWAETRLAANTLARSIEVALVNSTTLRGWVYGAFVAEPADFDLSPPRYGTRQDFGVSYV